MRPAGRTGILMGLCNADSKNHIACGLLMNYQGIIRK